MNKSNRSANTNTIQMLFDVICLIFSFVVATFITYRPKIDKGYLDYLVVLCIFILLYILLNKEARIYNITTFYYTDRIVKLVTKSFLISAFITTAMLFYLDINHINRITLASFYLIGYLVILSWTLFYHQFFARYFENKDIKRTIFAGKIEEFEKFNIFLKKTNMNMKALGYISFEDNISDKYLGTTKELEKLIRIKNVDQIYFMQSSDEKREIQKLLDLCVEMGVTARVVMDLKRPEKTYSYVSSIGTYPVLTYHTICLNTYEAVLKRVVDVIGSVIGIVVFSPVMLLTAIAIKLDSQGPILFKQTRVGMNGRRFQIYKFRSMYVNAEEQKKELMAQNEVNGRLMFKIKEDPRITKVGKFIRRMSIDELPQFFNVLFGNMSLVGTRPPTLDEVEQYERTHWRRISIKPGITGMWQVSGRSAITDFNRVVQLDTCYIDGWNIFVDFKIMMMTIWQIFTRKNAY